jgi:hypothetical protein
VNSAAIKHSKAVISKFNAEHHISKPEASAVIVSATNRNTENVTPARSHSSTTGQAAAFHRRSRSYISNDELS